MVGRPVADVAVPSQHAEREHRVFMCVCAVADALGFGALEPTALSFPPELAGERSLADRVAVDHVAYQRCARSTHIEMIRL